MEFGFVSEIIDGEGRETNYRKIEAGENIFNIIILDKNKSFSYSGTPSYTVKLPVNEENIQGGTVKFFNARKNAFKECKYTISTDSVYFNCGKDQDWRKVNKKYLKAEYEYIDEDKQVTEFINSLGYDLPETGFPVYDLSLKITGKKDNINGFNCKEAILQLYDNEAYTVWFTDEMDYSWCFDNFFSAFPGTVITAKSGDETLFELLEIVDTDFSNIPFTKEQIDSLIEFYLKNINLPGSK